MSLWYDSPRALRQRSMDEFTAPFWDVIGAQASTVWKESPVQSYADRVELEAERMGDPLDMGVAEMGIAPTYKPRTPELTEEDAKTRITDAGLGTHLKFTKGMREGELDLLIREKRKELARKDIMRRAEGGALQSMVGFGASLLTALADPVNVASAFIPVVGPSRYAYMLGKAGGGLGRGVTRFGVGAVEGAAGQALIEPFVASTQAEFQREYGLLNSFMNIAFGGAFGAGLHGAGGAVMDALRPGRVAFFRSYARWADETDIIAREYGLDLSPRLDLFRAELTGRIEEGQFGDSTRQAWQRYRAETSDLGREFGVEIIPTPDDFMRWLRLRRQKPRGAKAVEGDIGPAPRETIPEYDVPGSTAPVGRSFLEGADVVAATVTRRARAEPAPSIYEAFLDQVGDDAREAAIRYAASRLARGKVADTVPIYHAYGMERRLREATELSGPAAREAVDGLTPAQVRVAPGLWGDAFGYRLDYGDVGPKATLRPEGMYRGDKVIWERFGEEQFGEPRRVTEVAADGRVKIEGWQQWIRPEEVRLAEPGPAARRHTIEIEWGDLWAQVVDSQALMPAIARQRAARDLLGVLRDEQMGDPRSVFDGMRAADKPDADILYVKPDREAMTAASAQVQGQVKAVEKTARAAAPPSDPIAAVAQVSTGQQARTVDARLADDLAEALDSALKGIDEAIAKASPSQRAGMETIRGEINQRRAELRQASGEGTGSVREGAERAGTEPAGAAGSGKGESTDARKDDPAPEIRGDEPEGAALKFPTPQADARLAEAETRARAGGTTEALEKALMEADEGIGKSFAEAEWLDRYVSCVLRSVV